MGLAFDEDRVLKKMSVLAKEGWFLAEMTLFKYRFEKSEPKDLIYSMDRKMLNEDKEEYFDLFHSSGWNHVCSYGHFHFFSASNGTVPIYTDRKSYLEKYKAVRTSYLKMLIISVILFAITLLLKIFVSNRLNNKAFACALILAGGILAAIAVPCFMVTVAYIIRLKKECR
jgi:hypothetical protein